jgi:hypothetical protein
LCSIAEHNVTTHPKGDGRGRAQVPGIGQVCTGSLLCMASQ